ncbi:MAG: iron ABC transporter permease [Clostridia bacterium]|nr:iron ABC transporter permease [Clostridia bacterium]MBP3293607.1 iron ABC transporter permease [Clostridia bacterium]
MAKKLKENRGSVKLLRVGFLWILLAALLVILSVAAVNIGTVQYSIPEIFTSITAKEAELTAEQNITRTIVLNLRLPRVVLTILVGACLSAAGALLQAVMRNPLADPGSIGVSAGAGTAAITILLIFPNMTTALPMFAFVGAALACVLIYVMAWKDGVSPVRIILAGVAINSVLGAYNSLLQLMNSDNLTGVLAFMNGSLSGMSWTHVRTILSYSVIGLLLSLLCIRHANALQLGDEMAKNLGVRVNGARIALSAVSAFLAAATVSVVGMISFVGLVVPHISRMLVGSDYKVMLPTSILMGSLTLLVADTIGRTIVPGMEIPVGIVMSVCGGPFFLYMLRKRGKYNEG